MIGASARRQVEPDATTNERHVGAASQCWPDAPAIGLYESARNCQTPPR